MIKILIAWLCLVPVLAFAAAGIPSHGVGIGAGLPNYDHVVLVMEENHGYNQIVGDTTDAPYINNTLIAGGALFTNSFAATPTTHPSEPNYFALWSGSTQGIADDGTYTEGAASLGGRLIAAGVTFKGYVEDVAQRKHDPWESFTDSPGLGVNFSTWPAGPDYSSLSKLSWVIPNLSDDMHDGASNAIQISTGDTWLSTHIGGYATWALTHNSLLIVTFDEDENTEGNHIMTVFYGARVRPGQYGQALTHYNTLRTLTDLYGLAPLANAITVSPVVGCWR
jgi:phosphatidylinositol-3-phosphatase